MLVTGQPSVTRRLLPRRGCRRRASLDPLRDRLEPPCPCKPALILDLLQHGKHPGHQLGRLPRRAGLGAEELQQLLLHVQARVRPRVVRSGSGRPRRDQNAVRPREIAALDQRRREVGAEPQAAVVGVGQQGSGPLEQADRRGGVAAHQRSAPGRLEPLGRPLREPSGLLVGDVELDLAAVRLLEVAADELVCSNSSSPAVGLEPVGEALVQLRALAP